jgi:hypothetical protein
MKSQECHFPQVETSNSTWEGLDAQTRAILDGHGGEGIVAVRPSLVRTLRGNGNAAIILAQLLYWSRRLGNDQGWFYQTQRRLEAQTGLGADALRKATKILVHLDILETNRRGAPAKLYYRIHLRRLAALLLQHDRAGSVADHGPQLDAEYGRHLDPDHGPRLAAGDGPALAADHGPPHKENKKESREEMYSSSAPIADGPLAPGATHGHAESSTARAPTLSSMPIAMQSSGGHPASAGRAEQPRETVSAPGDLLLTDEPHGHAMKPRRPAAPPRPATPIADDFTVTAAMRTWARERVSAINLGRETERFINHAKANDRRQVDWPAAWRNWMLKALEFAEQSRRPAARGGVVV